MGNPMFTGGQAHELVGWANRLTVEQYQARRSWLERLTNPEFDPAVAWTQQLLTPVSAVPMAGVSRFVAADHFRVNTTPEAAVKIAYLGDNFQAALLGQVEENVERATLQIHRLVQGSLDAPILAALGTKAETALAQLWELLSKQPGGEEGTLLTNGYANIFYVRSAATGVLWAVDAYWDGNGWDVNAYSVERPLRWNAGNQVFSR